MGVVGLADLTASGHGRKLRVVSNTTYLGAQVMNYKMELLCVARPINTMGGRFGSWSRRGEGAT